MDSTSVSARRNLMRGTLAALALPLLAACESSPFSRRGDRRRTPSSRETEREREIERRKGENSSRADPPSAPTAAPQA